MKRLNNSLFALMITNSQTTHIRINCVNSEIRELKSIWEASWLSAGNADGRQKDAQGSNKPFLLPLLTRTDFTYIKKFRRQETKKEKKR